MAKKVTKAELKKFLVNMLTTNKKWAVNAMLRIYDNQTESEQSVGDTTNLNGIGFTVGDAKILTSFAQFYKSRGFLTDKQMKWVFPKMSKYAGQIMKMDYFSLEKLEVCYFKYNNNIAA